MKQSELKKVLKPLIKQCIKEVIFEEGVLSGLISEVVQGLGAREVIVETQQPSSIPTHSTHIEPDPELVASLEETKRKLEESLGSQFSGVFENTEALSRGGSLNESKVQSPLSAFAPNDPGVDISELMASAGGKNWKHMI